MDSKSHIQLSSNNLLYTTKCYKKKLSKKFRQFKNIKEIYWK